MYGVKAVVTETNNRSQSMVITAKICGSELRFECNTTVENETLTFFTKTELKSASVRVKYPTERDAVTGQQGLFFKLAVKDRSGEYYYFDINPVDNAY